LGQRVIAHQEHIIKRGEEKQIYYELRLYDPGKQRLSIGGRSYPVQIRYRKSTLALHDVELYSIGEQVHGSGRLWNTGSDTLTQSVRIEANGIRIREEQLRLFPGESQHLSFTYRAPA